MGHLDNITVDSAGIRRCTTKDPVLSKVYKSVQSGKNLLEGPLYSAFHTKRYELSVENGYLLWGSRMIIPHTLRQQVLKELHQCHLGMVKIKVLAQNYVWWPGMDADIKEKVNRCYTCQNLSWKGTTTSLRMAQGTLAPGPRGLPTTTAEICS